MVCPLDGLPLHGVGPAFLGVSAKGINAVNPDHPDAAEVAAQLRAVGVTTIGTKIHWDNLEPRPGVWNWELFDPQLTALAEGGTRLVVTLRDTPTWASRAPDAQHPDRYPPTDIDDWANFVAAAAERYPWVAVWEIWNEPNDAGFFAGSMDDYLTLLNAAAGVVRSLAPEAMVAAPAVTFHPWSFDTALEWVRRVAAEGDFDVLTIHLYHWSPADSVSTVRAVRAALDAAGREATPIVVTEVNAIDLVVSCEDYSHRPQDWQAELLRQLFVCLGNAGADGMLWFRATDTGLWCDDGSRQRAGVLDEYLEPKESWWALSRIARYISDEIPGQLLIDGFEDGLAAWTAHAGSPVSAPGFGWAP